MPKISIIVPVYNSSSFLTSTIDNLIRQDVDKEIICVDDGSIDNSLEILKSFAKKYPFVRVVRKKNGGVSSARNLGIRYASGDYLIFVDSDDALEECALSYLLEKYEENQDVDLIVFSYACYNIYGQVNENIINIKSGKYLKEDWFLNWYEIKRNNLLSCIGTKLYRRSIVEKFKIRFNENMNFLEDEFFCLDYMGCAKYIYYINQPFYKYIFINDNSLITQYKSDYPEKLFLLYEKLGNVLGKDNMNSSTFRKSVCIDIVNCLNNDLANNEVATSTRKGHLKRLMSNGLIRECLFVKYWPAKWYPILFLFSHESSYVYLYMKIYNGIKNLLKKK